MLETAEAQGSRRTEGQGLSLRSALAGCSGIFPEIFFAPRIPDFSPTRMYTIDVRPTSDILPRMFAVDFELRPADWRATVVVLAAAPEAAWREPSSVSRNVSAMAAKGTSMRSSVR